jgi:hypothetical protein
MPSAYDDDVRGLTQYAATATAVSVIATSTAVA